MAYRVLLLGKSSLKANYFKSLACMDKSDEFDETSVDFRTIKYTSENCTLPPGDEVDIQLISVPFNIIENEALKSLYRDADFYIPCFDPEDLNSIDILDKICLPQLEKLDNKKQSMTPLVELTRHSSADCRNPYPNEINSLLNHGYDSIATADLSASPQGLRDNLYIWLTMYSANQLEEHKEENTLETPVNTPEKSESPYEKYWDESKEIKGRLMELFYNYAGGTYYTGRIFHPSRNHKDIVNTVITQLDKDEITCVEAFNTLADTPKLLNGSLNRRLTFARAKLEQDESIDNDLLHVSKIAEESVVQEEKEKRGWLGFM